MNLCRIIATASLLFTSLRPTAAARKWTDFQLRIVTQDGRVRELFEDDVWAPLPLPLPQETEAPQAVISSPSPTVAPSTAPTLAPTLSAVDERTQPPTTIVRTARPSARPSTSPPTDPPTLRKTPSPTAPPTEVPTAAPTLRYENVEGNGGCEDNELLFALFMYDQGMDGWDEAQISIVEENVFGFMETKFKGTLADGKTGVEYICLKYDTCYHAVILGGIWEKEIRWEVRPVVLGSQGEYKWAIAKGPAPVDCSFSFGNPGYPVCETTCLSWVPPTPAPTARRTPAPTARPTPSPTLRPTPAPTAPPTPAPTSGPTPALTLRPTLSPTKPPTVAPTKAATDRPSLRSTDEPTDEPTGNPTLQPVLV